MKYPMALPGLRCPNCGTSDVGLSRSLTTGEIVMPSPGDLGICEQCACFIEYRHSASHPTGLTEQVLSQQVFDELPSHLQLILNNTQAQVRKAIAKRSARTN